MSEGEPEPVVPLVKDYEKLKAKLNRPPRAKEETKPERGMLHGFIGRHVVLHMRNDLAISCEIRGESRYELLIRAVDEMDAIVLKHAIDFIELDLDDG
jgi:hypothetical protein